MTAWADRSRWVGAGATIFKAIALVVPALAALAPRATVPLLIAAVVLLALGFAAERRRPPLPSLATMAGFAALVLWAAFSSRWALAPVARPVAALFGAMALGLLLVGWAPRDARADAIGDALLLGIGIGLLVYAFEVVSGAWLTRLVHGFTWRDIIDPVTGGISIHAYLINGTAILSLLLWPAIGMLVRRGRWPLAVILALLVAAATVRFGSDAGMLALVFGLLVWGLAAWLGGRATRIAAVAFALIVLATPFAAQRLPSPPEVERLMAEMPQVPSSAFVRLITWRFAADRIAERPILGWGFDAARRIPGGGDAYVLRAPDGRTMVKDIFLPLHPHNQILQVWLELGLVGALIVAIAGGWLIWRLGGLAPPGQNATLALAATIITYDYLSFGAWQSWWIAAVFLAAAMQSALAHAEEASVF